MNEQQYIDRKRSFSLASTETNSNASSMSDFAGAAAGTKSAPSTKRLMRDFSDDKRNMIRDSNREAAQKCRKRKKRNSKDLDKTIEILLMENELLTIQYDILRKWVVDEKAGNNRDDGIDNKV